VVVAEDPASFGEQPTKHLIGFGDSALAGEDSGEQGAGV
jgi:hypothetical protein